MYEPVPLKLMDDLAESSFNIQNKLINEVMRDLCKQRENQILSRLKDFGIELSTEQEKTDFARTRLSIVTNINKPQWKELYLDGTTLVASWWETVEFENDGVNYTAICGNPPK